MNIPDKETASKLLKKWVSEGNPHFYRFLSRLDDKESEIVRLKFKKDKSWTSISLILYRSERQLQRYYSGIVEKLKVYMEEVENGELQ